MSYYLDEKKPEWWAEQMDGDYVVKTDPKDVDYGWATGDVYGEYQAFKEVGKDADISKAQSHLSEVWKKWAAIPGMILSGTMGIITVVIIIMVVAAVVPLVIAGAII